MKSLAFEWVTNKFNKRDWNEMDETLLLGNGSRVFEHCTAVFTDELFQIERSNGAVEIKEAAPKRRKVKPDCNQQKNDQNKTF